MRGNQSDAAFVHGDDGARGIEYQSWLKLMREEFGGIEQIANHDRQDAVRRQRSQRGSRGRPKVEHVPSTSPSYVTGLLPYPNHDRRFTAEPIPTPGTF